MSEKVDGVLQQWHVSVSGPLGEIHPGRVYRVRSTEGEDLILKKLALSQNSQDRLDLEHEILRHLDSTGVPIALPLAAPDGRTFVLHSDALFTLSPDLVEAGTERTPWTEMAGRYGEAIAQLHESLSLLPTAQFAERTWRNRPLEESLDQCLPRLVSELPRAEARRLSRSVEAVAPLMRSSLTDLPEQLIHRDCHPGNILVAGDKIVGFIDCDHFSIGSPVLDLAYFLDHLIKWDVRDAARTQEWIEQLPDFVEGYVARSPLSLRELEAISPMLVFVLLKFAYTFLDGNAVEPLQVELDALEFVCSSMGRIHRSVLSIAG